MNEAQAILATSQHYQGSILVLGGQLMSAILIGACIIGVAILLHAIIHGLLVRGKANR